LFSRLWIELNEAVKLIQGSFGLDHKKVKLLIVEKALDWITRNRKKALDCSALDWITRK